MENNIIKKLIKLSNKAYLKNESPISAIIVKDGKIISESYNKRNRTNRTIDHAEIMAITKANKKLKSWRLNKCTLYVTLEPCDMCKNIIKESRIDRVIYLIPRYKNKKIYNKVEFELIETTQLNKNFIDEYKKILQNFWKNKR